MKDTNTNSDNNTADTEMPETADNSFESMENVEELSQAYSLAMQENTCDTTGNSNHSEDSSSDSRDSIQQTEANETQPSDTDEVSNETPEAADTIQTPDVSEISDSDTTSDQAHTSEPVSEPAAESTDETAGETEQSQQEGQSENSQPEDSGEDDTDDDDDDLQPEGDLEISTASVVEAILFAADEPIGVRRIVEIINAGNVKEVKKHIRSLNKKYQKMGCAFRIEELAGGYQMLTKSDYNPWLSKLIKVRSESKLTAAAMETLAIIAYKQPLMRVEIENIRGVAAGEMIRQLIEKGLVKIVGRAEELGRPLLYGTTQKFLDVFGLASIKDLPLPEEHKKQ